MLGLADEIPGDKVRIGRFVGQDQAVGRTGEHVDADPAEQNALGFRHELVAGADQDIGFGQAEQAEGHCRDALDPTERQNCVGAAQVGRVDDRRRDPDTGPGRRTGGNVAASGDLRRGHRHQGRSDVAVPPARRIAPRRLARDRLLPRDQAGGDFDLHVADRVFLGLGKAADIVPGKADVVFELLGHLLCCGLDLVTSQDDVAVVAVESGRISPSPLHPRRPRSGSGCPGPLHEYRLRRL